MTDVGSVSVGVDVNGSDLGEKLAAKIRAAVLPAIAELNRELDGANGRIKNLDSGGVDKLTGTMRAAAAGARDLRDGASEASVALNKINSEEMRKLATSARTAASAVKDVGKNAETAARITSLAADKMIRDYNRVADAADRSAQRQIEAAAAVGAANEAASRAGGGGGSGGRGGGGVGRRGGGGGDGDGGGGFIGGLVNSPGVLNAVALGTTLVGPALLGITNLTGAVQQLGQAGLLLPGVFAAAGSSLITAKIATLGMSSAVKDLYKALGSGDPKELKKANAEIALLPKNVQDTVHAFGDLFPALKDVQRTLADNMFDGVGQQIRDVGGRDIPIFKQGLGQISTAWNGTIKSILSAAGSDSTGGFLTRIFGNTAQAQTIANQAIAPIVHAVGTLTSTASNFLPRLATGLDALATRADNFISKIAGDGTLDRLINQGIDASKNLGTSFLNVLKIVNDLTTAAGGDGGFLKALSDGTTKLHEFLSSADGQNKLKDFFASAREEWNQWKPILLDLGRGIGQVFSGLHDWGTTILPIFGQVTDFLIKTPGLVSGLAEGFVLFRTFGGLLDKFGGSAGGAASSVERLAGGIGKLSGLQTLGAVTGIAALLSGNQFINPSDGSKPGVGSVLGGAGLNIGGGALAGFSVGGPVGAAIGAAIGAAVSLAETVTRGLNEAKARFQEQLDRDKDPNRPGNPATADQLTGRDKILQPSLNAPTINATLVPAIRAGKVPGFAVNDQGQVVNTQTGQVVPLPDSLTTPPPGAPPPPPVPPAVLANLPNVNGVPFPAVPGPPAPPVKVRSDVIDPNTGQFIVPGSGGPAPVIPQGTNPILAGPSAAGVDTVNASIKSAIESVGVLSRDITSLPQGAVKISDSTPDVIARLKQLGYAVTQLPGGVLKVTVQYIDPLGYVTSGGIGHGVGLTAAVPGGGKATGGIVAAIRSGSRGYAGGGIVGGFSGGGGVGSGAGTTWDDWLRLLASQAGANNPDLTGVPRSTLAAAPPRQTSEGLYLNADGSPYNLVPDGVPIDPLPGPPTKISLSDADPAWHLSPGYGIGTWAKNPGNIDPGLGQVKEPTGGGKYNLPGGGIGMYHPGTHNLPASFLEWLKRQHGTIGAARGAVLPGYSPGVDNMLVPLSGGEGIIIPEAMRALGANWLFKLNSRFRPGISRQGYADGGLPPGGIPGAPVGDPVVGLLTQIRDLLAGSGAGDTPLKGIRKNTENLTSTATGGLPGTGAAGTKIGPFGTPLKQKGDPAYRAAAAAISALGGDPEEFLGTDPTLTGPGGGAAGVGNPDAIAALTQFARTGVATPGVDPTSTVARAILAARNKKKGGLEDNQIADLVNSTLTTGTFTGQLDATNTPLIEALLKGAPRVNGLAPAANPFGRTTGAGAGTGADGITTSPIAGAGIGQGTAGIQAVFVVNFPGSAVTDIPGLPGGANSALQTGAGAGGGSAAGPGGATNFLGKSVVDAATGAVGSTASDVAGSFIEALASGTDFKIGTPTATSTSLTKLVQQGNPLAAAAAFGLNVPDYSRDGGTNGTVGQQGQKFDAKGRMYSDSGSLIDRTMTDLSAQIKASFDQLKSVINQVKDNTAKEVLEPLMRTAVTEGIAAMSNATNKKIGEAQGEAAGPPIAEAVSKATDSAYQAGVSAGSAQNSSGGGAGGGAVGAVGGVLGNLFDEGGLWESGTYGTNLSGSVERVLSPSQTALFDAGLFGGWNQQPQQQHHAAAEGVDVTSTVGADFFGVSQLPIIGAIINLLVGVLLKLIGVQIDARNTLTDIGKDAREFRGAFQKFDATGRLINDTSGITDRSSTSEQEAADERVRILKLVIEGLIKFIIEKIVIPIGQAVANAAISAGGAAAGAAVNSQAPGAGGIVSALIDSAGTAGVGIVADLASSFTEAATPVITDSIFGAFQSLFPGASTSLFGGGLLSMLTNPLQALLSPLTGGIAGMFATLLGGLTFDDGGVASGVGLMPKATIRPERVLSPSQTQSFDRLVTALERGGRNGGQIALHAPITVVGGGEQAANTAHTKLLSLLGGAGAGT